MCQAKVEIRELILASETEGDLELTHNAYDGLVKSGVDSTGDGS